MIIMPRTEQDKAWAVAWARQQLEEGWDTPGYPVVFMRGDEIACIVVLHDYRPPVSIMMSIASVNPRWASKSNIFWLYYLSFHHFRVRRVTVMVDKKNKRSRKFVEGVGWKLEGVARQAAIDGGDICIYGMLPEDFKWFDEVPKYLEELKAVDTYYDEDTRH